MSKIQKIEFLIIILLLTTFMLFTIEVMSSFGQSSFSNIEIFWGMCSVFLSILFLIIYILKIIKENAKLIRLLLCFFPVLSITFSVLFVNGVFSFNSDFFVLNIISIILEIIMIILYNLFILCYYGKNRKMIITLILYNLVVISSSIRGVGINYIHHYYFGYLLFAILGGYIELMVRNKILALK